MNGSPLVERWREHLGNAEGIGLREALTCFPELEHAVSLPELTTDVQSESYLCWDGEGIKAEVQVVWRTADNVRVGTLSLDICTAAGSASLEDMHLPRSYQGQGLGRAVITELVQLGQELGLDELILMAFDVGRYAWARCGFDFFDETERKRIVAAAEEFAQRLSRPFDGRNIEHSWELAELPGADVPLADVAAVRGDPSPAEGAVVMKFGQALLVGPHNNEWSGRLELADGSSGRVQLAKA